MFVFIYIKGYYKFCLIGVVLPENAYIWHSEELSFMRQNKKFVEFDFFFEYINFRDYFADMNFAEMKTFEMIFAELSFAELCLSKWLCRVVRHPDYPFIDRTRRADSKYTSIVKFGLNLPKKSKK